MARTGSGEQPGPSGRISEQTSRSVPSGPCLQLLLWTPAHPAAFLWPDRCFTYPVLSRCGPHRRHPPACQAPQSVMELPSPLPGAAMEKGYVSVFLLLMAISCALAKDVGKKDSKDTTAKPKLPQTLSRGWGDQLIWTQTYEEALFRAKHSQKPLMIIHHLEDCPHSQALKKVFAEHKDIQKLAEKFILLNLVYETTDKNLAPDGQYVPRILFIDPSLTVRADITGRYSNRLYAYEPSDISLLYSNMQKALKLLKTEL